MHHKADKTDYLLIDDFINKLACWGNSEVIDKAIDKHIELNINNLREKSGKNGSKTAVADQQAKPKLKIKAQNKPAERKVDYEIDSDQQSKKAIQNKSKHYLKLANKKQEEEEKALAMNIEK